MSSTMTTTTVAFIAVILASAYLYLRTRPHPTHLTGTPSRGYLLTNKVTHARLFPVKHAFAYPTLSILVSLDALECRELDVRVPLRAPFGLSGYLHLNLFRFGSKWGTLLSLRGDSYLGTGRRDAFDYKLKRYPIFGWIRYSDDAQPRPASIRAKLVRVLIERGVITDASEMRDAWMMTMPAICGFEGINPLTVYFCYRPSGEASVVILEVHNTFGEGHVYVLQLGKNEDPSPPRGYDHQWTFPRRFFVSPFNDRSGFYTVAVKLPSHPPFNLPSTLDDPPKPSIQVHLHVPSSTCLAPTLFTDPIDRSNIGPLKLVAHLTPKSSVPLTSRNLLTALSHYPLALLSTLPRILYHAWILHYLKRLPIFGRPEPITGHPRPPLSTYSEGQKLARPVVDDHLNQGAEHPGGVISQQLSFLERYARTRMENFLADRCMDLTMRIVLVPGDPSEDLFWLAKPELLTLTIKYTSPRFFTLFLLAPSARLFFFAGCKTETDGERPLFQVSDETTFMRFFDPDPKLGPGLGCIEGREVNGWMEWVTQRIRLLAIPRDAFSENLGRHKHPLATFRTSFWTQLCDLGIVCTLIFMDWVQERVFRLLRVTFVEGTEPWGRSIWRRAGRVAGETEGCSQRYGIERQ